jgi:hypothetical protein
MGYEQRNLTSIMIQNEKWRKKKSEKERIEGHPEIKCWDIINVLIYK